MPTVVIGNNTGDNYSGTDDARLSGDSWDVLNNFGGSANFEIKYTDIHNNALLKFSGLSNIPNTSSVDSASIRLNGSNAWDNIQFHVRPVLRAWIEGTQTGADRSGDNPYSCCYNEYGSGNAWTTGGCMGDGTDRETSTSGTITIGTTAQYYQSSDLSSLVGRWVSGALSNNGVIITRDTQDGFYYTSVVSSEGTDGQRPYLSVTYTESGGGSLPVIINNYRQQGVM